jgi:hypothetical protein
VERTPRRDNESDDAYDRRIRSQYVDRCRFLLPAAANANVGMTANARVIEMTIRKMLSHPLEEVRQIGEKMKEVSKAETPTWSNMQMRMSIWWRRPKALTTEYAENLRRKKSNLSELCDLRGEKLV